jgi:drug/metabolite transporter (DMT)-like permease
MRWILAMVGLFLIWSNSFHSIAWLRRSLGAWDLVIVRFAPVGLFCLATTFLWGWRENLRILRRSPWRIVVMGLLIVPVYNLCLNWGQGAVPAGTASLLISTNPLFTYLFALAIRQERQRWRKTAGLLLSFVGVYLLLRAQGRSFGAGYSDHALATLAAPFSWAIATVVGKPLVTRESPLRVTYLALAIGSAAFVPLSLADASTREAVVRFAATDWVALAHLSIACTIVGFAIWYAALRHLPSSSVAAFVLLNPPLTLAFGPLWGTDRPTASVIGYGVWILAGVLLSTWRVPERPARPALGSAASP